MKSARGQIPGFPAAKRPAIWAAAVLALAACGGCVAVDVGQPEVFWKEYAAGIQDAGHPRVVSRRPIENATGRDEGGRRVVRIGLQGQVVSERPREQCWERIGIAKQRRLAVGLLPALGERVLRGDMVPDFGEESGDPKGFSQDFRWGGLFGIYLGLPWKLLVEPFRGSWECQHHDWRPAPEGKEAFRHFSRDERERIGLATRDPNDFLSGFSHMAPAGFHRHCKYTVKGPEPIAKRTPAPPRTVSATRNVRGPYRIALDLPGCGFARTLDVPPGDTGVDFDLGGIRSDGPFADGTVRFLSPAGGRDEAGDADDRILLEMAAGMAFPVTVQVKAAERPRAGPGAAAGTELPAVKEIHHYHETRVEVERKTEEAPWEIETEEAYHGGRATYLVTIRDASKKAFEVEREVKPEIERLLREAFAASVPGMDESRVRAYALPDFAGRAIRFRGVAFSVQPVHDGWRYDPDTRRGTVRLRLSEGMAPEKAERWARENIEAIVKEKNVALEAGAVPPEGAVYRSLGETLDGGVLTVDFEAVE